MCHIDRKCHSATARLVFNQFAFVRVLFKDLYHIKSLVEQVWAFCLQFRRNLISILSKSSIMVDYYFFSNLFFPEFCFKFYFLRVH